MSGEMYLDCWELTQTTITSNDGWAQTSILGNCGKTKYKKFKEINIVVVVGGGKIVWLLAIRNILTVLQEKLGNNENSRPKCVSNNGH